MFVLIDACLWCLQLKTTLIHEILGQTGTRGTSGLNSPMRFTIMVKPSFSNANNNPASVTAKLTFRMCRWIKPCDNNLLAQGHHKMFQQLLCATFVQSVWSTTLGLLKTNQRTVLTVSKHCIVSFTWLLFCHYNNLKIRLAGGWTQNFLCIVDEI